MAEFLDQIARAPQLGWLEANRKIIEHYNRGEKLMAGFDETGYFMFHGVKVCEKGKLEEVKAKENRTTESLHGGK